MYRYDSLDQSMLDDRVAQFRGQTERYLNGELAENEFRPLRLQNGLYIQRLAPMLRVAIPYGMLESRQLRKIAHIARKYDKGYAHFSTRQNVQFNWPRLEEVPEILAELASVQMHSIQTSGNCIRNTTADQFSGVARDEIEDARPYCELIRQWSTFHPEFAFLPRKFKIAVNGSLADRAAVRIHDIGLILVKDHNGAIGFEVLVGGGLGRTPIIGSTIREFLPVADLLSYLEAIVRIYNQYGRRDNLFKARIKILVKALGVEEFRARVEQQWESIRTRMPPLTPAQLERARACFAAPAYAALDDQQAEQELRREREANRAFDRWMQRNTTAHRVPGYAIVTLSLKPAGIAPGDATDRQMDLIADLADRYSFGELRVTHEQNLVLADVPKSKLPELWEIIRKAGLATPNIGLLTDIICCPGGDFCSLANAKSIPVAEAIQRRFDDLDYLHDLGDIDLNISGCMNACGHHHIGQIGILGVDKKGAEFYQVSLGGNSGTDASLGTILGPSFAQDAIADVIAAILGVYVAHRHATESFLATYRRIGIEPFREAAYGKADQG
ncbi:MAG: nitrite/sulfite reductase [Gammaproteobacteria bacterium]|nr:nitrite/sulfite reductase [Gammaproteobacteria bacterium]